MKLTFDLALFLRTQSPLGRCTLELTSFAGLHVVTSASQILKHTRALHLLFEHAERRFDAIAFVEVNFNHGSYPPPTLVTFSAAGPFWPCTTSNSTFSPSASDLKPPPWIAE